MIKRVDKFTVKLSGFDLFVHLVTKHNWSDKKTINFMKENNQDVSFYEEYQKIKKEYLEKHSDHKSSYKKNKSKKRGYLYSIKADLNFRCHNCGSSMTFSNFLKEIDTVLHKQYVFERFKQGSTGRGSVVEEPKFNFEAPQFRQKIDLPRADTNQRAKEYLEKRKLNPSDFYYTDKFKAWTNSHMKTFDSVYYDEPRIIITLF